MNCKLCTTILERRGGGFDLVYRDSFPLIGLGHVFTKYVKREQRASNGVK